MICMVSFLIPLANQNSKIHRYINSFADFDMDERKLINSVKSYRRKFQSDITYTEKENKKIKRKTNRIYSHTMIYTKFKH